MAALAFEIEHRIDHMFEHLGPGNHAILGDVADQEQGEVRTFRQADQFLRRGAHLGDGAGRRIQAVDKHGLHRIGDHHLNVAAVFQGGDDIADIGGRGQLYRRMG